MTSCRVRSGRIFLPERIHIVVLLSLVHGMTCAAGPPRPRADGIIVQFSKASSQRQAVLTVLERQFGPLEVQPVLDTRAPSDWRRGNRASQTVLVRFTETVSWTEAAEFCMAEPGVAYAEPNWIGSLCAAPTDPFYAQQQADLALIRMESAWDVQSGADGSVIVAVIDSGIDVQHADLAGATDLARSWNFVEGNASVLDDLGHGTRVAGILGAAANNGEGITGIAPGCTIISYDVVDSNGQVTVAHVASALNAAAMDGVHVANLSLRFSADSITLREACEAATDAGMLLIAGAGNDNQGTLPVYPASYPTVLGVGAVRDDGTSRAPWSNYRGTESSIVSLVAPGETIYTTTPGSQYNGTFGSGTSFAAPMVAGVAALLKAQNPDQGMAAIGAHILETCAPEPAGFAPAGGSGAGLLNAEAAVATAMTPRFTVEIVVVDDAGVAQPNAAWDKGETVRLLPVLKNLGADVGNLSAVLATTDPAVTILDGSATWNPLAWGTESVPSDSGFQVSQSASSTARRVPLQLQVTGSGAWSPALVDFTVDARNLYQFPSPILMGDTVLTADQTYLFTQNTVLFDGATLTIEPGTTLRFAPGVRLELRGAVTAIGTESAPITLTSESGDADFWEGLWLREQLPSGTFQHCTFQFGPVKDDSVVARFQNCLFDRTGGASSYEGGREAVWGYEVGMEVGWELTSPNKPTYAQFGKCLARVPDITGDGFDELIVGAPGDSSGTSPLHAGRAYIYDGRTRALIHELKSPNEVSDLWGFGTAVVGLPDITGDGKGDVLVGGPMETVETGTPSRTGRAYVFDGGTGALVHTLQPPTAESGPGTSWVRFGLAACAAPHGDGSGRVAIAVAGWRSDHLPNVWMFDGESGEYQSRLQVFLSGSYANSGELELAAVPDVTGDGWDDLILGADMQSNTQLAATVMDWVAGANVLTITEQLQAYGRPAVAGVRDVSGDGLGDLVVGILDNLSLHDGATGNQIHSLLRYRPSGEIWGLSAIGIPDVTGDGGGDVLVGAPSESRNSQAYIVDGAAGLPVFEYSPLSDPQSGNQQAFGDAVCLLLGNSGQSPEMVVVGDYRKQEYAGRVSIFPYGFPIEDCTAIANPTGGGFRASSVKGGRAFDCSGTGIRATTVWDSTAARNQGKGIDARVVLRSEARENSATGIVATTSSSESLAVDNAWDGIEGGFLVKCVTESNMGGISGRIVENSVSRYNADSGIKANEAVVDSIAEGNQGGGIQTSSLSRSVAVRNGGGLTLTGPSTGGYFAENSGVGVTGGSLSSSVLLGHSGGGARNIQIASHSSFVGNDAFGVQDVPTLENCRVSYNTGTGVIRADHFADSVIESNGASTGFDVLEDRSSSVIQQTNFQGNYWGTETTAEIFAAPSGQLKNLSRVHDFFDDTNLALVDFRNALPAPGSETGPDDSAPAFLLHALPDHRTALNVGFTTFTLVFSEPMDTSVSPAVTFGREAPYDTHVVDPDPGWLPDGRTWRGRFWVQTDTGEGAFRMRVSQARSADGFDIPDDTFRRLIIDFGAPVANAGAALGGKRTVTISWQGNGLEQLARRSLPQGFHVLRSISGEPGTYLRANPTLLPPDTRGYVDSNLEPGTEYFYMVFLVDDRFDAVQWIPPVSARTEEPELPEFWSVW